MTDEPANAVRCKVCKDVIPVNTGYIFTACSCADENKPYIAVDGGDHYVRYIGEPDQFEFIGPHDLVLSEKEENKDE